MKKVKLIFTLVVLVLFLEGCDSEEFICSDPLDTMEINFGEADCHRATIVYTPCREQRFDTLFNLTVSGAIRRYALNDWGGSGLEIIDFKEPILIEPDSSLNQNSAPFEQEIDFSEFPDITHLIIGGNVGSRDGSPIFYRQFSKP